MHNVHHKDLKILLETTRPNSILLIDPNPEALPSEALPRDCLLTRLTTDQILSRSQSMKQFDLGVVANTLEYLDRKTASSLVSRLRDLHTRRFVILAPIGEAWKNQRSHWERTDFLGYGMTLLSHYQVNGKSLHLYHYAIESYKTTPEWFNSHHWAHPEFWKP